MLDKVIKKINSFSFFKKNINFLKIKLPHIPRIKTAGNFLGVGKLFLLFSLFLIVLANFGTDSLLEQTEERNLIEQVLYNPSSFNWHENLGEYYFDIGKKSMAENEYKIAQMLYQQEDENSPWQQWLSKKTAEAKIREEISSWEKIAAALPNYYYARLKLAVLHYDIGEKNIALELINQVIRTNPGNKTALSFAEILR